MLQQLLGDGQIDERRMNVPVTEVGGKIGQAALRINSLTVPSGYAVNNESVPQVVNARPTPTGPSVQPGSTNDMAE